MIFILETKRMQTPFNLAPKIVEEIKIIIFVSKFFFGDYRF